jgi:hypothetical protein
MRRPSIPFARIPFPRARAERVEVLFSPAPELTTMLLLDPRDPPKDTPADFVEDEDEMEEFEDDDEDEEDETI